MALPRPLHGYVPVMVTPFAEDGSFMADAMTELVQWQIGRGAEALCIAAGNGECSAMTSREIGRVVRTAVDAAGGRLPVISGALGPARDDVAGAVAAIQAGMENGADAVLVTPHTARPEATQEDVLARYRAIASESGAPIVAYNSPRHYGVNLDATMLAELADSIDLAGLKEASRDFDHIGMVVAAHAQRFPIFVGPGYLIMPGVALGAAGFLSTGPDLLGADSARILPLAKGPPCDERRALHHRVAGIYRLLLESDLGPSPAPLKAALNMLGLPAGVARDPAKRLAPSDVDRLRAGLQQLGLLG